MSIKKCNLCKHKSEKGIYNLEMCIMCSDNPFVIDDRFDAKVKEIRPEKAGELWQAGNDSFFFTVNSDKIAGDNGDTYEIKDYEMIHGKHGWIRLYPPVEDDSVERIEFNNVDWDLSGCWQTKPMPFVSYDGGSKDWGDIRDAVINQPKMKMILEIPKDKP